MIFPKLISIDTSIFGKIAKDYFSDNEEKRDKATRTIEFLNENGFIPFLSFHHIQEILQHENDSVVFDRWSLIKRFPTVAWLCSYSDKNVLGSIFDIHLTEVKHLVDSEKTNLDSTLLQIKNSLIRYSSGEEFITKFESVYCQLRELELIDIQRSKQIESLSHVRDKKVDDLKLSELNSSMLRSAPEVKGYLEQYGKELEASLKEKGDKKLLNHTKVVGDFVENVETQGKELYKHGAGSLLEKFVLNCGVRLNQIDSKTTIGELGYIAIYNSKIKLISESLNWELGRAEGLSQEDVTSWVIWKEIDKMMKNETYAHGSNMIDKHMSIFALYVDVFTVDKRVKEYFRQLRRKTPRLNDSFKNIVKLSNYSDIQNSV